MSTKVQLSRIDTFQRSALQHCASRENSRPSAQDGGRRGQEEGEGEEHGALLGRSLQRRFPQVLISIPILHPACLFPYFFCFSFLGHPW